MHKKVTTLRSSSASRGPGIESAAPGKKHQQSEHTRIRLLRAAEKVFTRDGFEAAKLEEIASEAGYTRGAFYANFESKEDLFLAMLEEQIQGRIRSVSEAAKRCTVPAEKLAALREHFTTVTHDRQWTVLALEFKLFALRHHELKAKVSAMRKRIFAAATAALEEQLKSSGVTLPVSTGAFAMALGVLTHGLALDCMLDRSISTEEIHKIGTLFFDCMTQPR